MLGLTTTTLSGCVIPPRLQEVADGGENRAPSVITASTTPRPGAFDHNQQKVATFNVALQDPDRQALTLRIFLDRKYDKVVPISSSVTPGGEELQSKLFTISGLCDQLVDSVLGAHLLELYVSDGGFVDSGSDLRVVQQGALGTSVIWELKCVPPVTGPDGGA